MNHADEDHLLRDTSAQRADTLLATRRQLAKVQAERDELAATVERVALLAHSWGMARGQFAFRDAAHHLATALDPSNPDAAA